MLLYLVFVLISSPLRIGVLISQLREQNIKLFRSLRQSKIWWTCYVRRDLHCSATWTKKVGRYRCKVWMTEKQLTNISFTTQIQKPARYHHLHLMTFKSLSLCKYCDHRIRNILKACCFYFNVQLCKWERLSLKSFHLGRRDPISHEQRYFDTKKMHMNATRVEYLEI